ncbi:hypothetical protein FXF69_00980 [Actinomadura chibensis]|uniref:Uncharacterized protein n=2 Tax=Actinomadura chibensis TaxID=392828 RepID=A0A5D0NT97_9ACTN|nr:hypothetical protein FXF69_00980 [Actinomadura chibensis]
MHQLMGELCDVLDITTPWLFHNPTVYPSPPATPPTPQSKSGREKAIRAELTDWRVWHPLPPERPTALAEAVRAGRLAARTVIWLNEAQFYLQAVGGEE